MKAILIGLLAFSSLSAFSSINKGHVRKFKCDDNDHTTIKIFEYFPNKSAGYCIISNSKGTVKTDFSFGVDAHGPAGSYDYVCSNFTDLEGNNIVARIQGNKNKAEGELFNQNVACKRVYALPLLFNP